MVPIMDTTEMIYLAIYTAIAVGLIYLLGYRRGDRK